MEYTYISELMLWLHWGKFANRKWVKIASFLRPKTACIRAGLEKKGGGGFESGGDATLMHAMVLKFSKLFYAWPVKLYS